MKEIDAAAMRANLPRLTADRCRENATVAMVNAERLFDEGDTAGALYWQQNATTWATLAQTSLQHAAPAPPPDREHECCHNSQRLPGARLLAAGDPEPQVNPGVLYVDPAGSGARYLVRVDGAGTEQKWLWCDSLAEAETTADEAVTWSAAMGCGIIRVREATEREQIEFRNGTGGAAFDLIRRLLGTLATLAENTAGREDMHLWLDECRSVTHLAFHTWQWPAPPAAPGTYAAAGTDVDPDGEEWAEAHARRDTLTVRVENPGPDLERLTSDTLVRLRDQIQTVVIERAQTGARAAAARSLKGREG